MPHMIHDRACARAKCRLRSQAADVANGRWCHSPAMTPEVNTTNARRHGPICTGPFCWSFQSIPSNIMAAHRAALTDSYQSRWKKSAASMNSIDAQFASKKKNEHNCIVNLLVRTRICACCVSEDFCSLRPKFFLHHIQFPHRIVNM